MFEFDLPAPKKKKFIPPTLEEAQEYFQLHRHPEMAIPFWEHFENCDWRLSSGRGAKMKSWPLAANKWIRDNWKFEPQGRKPEADSEEARRETIRRRQLEEQRERERERNAPAPKVDPIEFLKKDAPELANYLLKNRQHEKEKTDEATATKI